MTPRAALSLLFRKDIVDEALNDYWDTNENKNSTVLRVANEIIAETDSVEVDKSQYPNPVQFL